MVHAKDGSVFQSWKKMLKLLSELLRLPSNLGEKLEHPQLPQPVTSKNESEIPLDKRSYNLPTVRL